MELEFKLKDLDWFMGHGRANNVLYQVVDILLHLSFRHQGLDVNIKPLDNRYKICCCFLQKAQKAQNVENDSMQSSKCNYWFYFMFKAIIPLLKQAMCQLTQLIIIIIITPLQKQAMSDVLKGG